MLRAAFEDLLCLTTCFVCVVSECGSHFVLAAFAAMYGKWCFQFPPCDSSVAVEVTAASHHGKYLWEPVEEPDRQEGDEDSHGGAGCRWENHHPLQAEAWGDRHHHSHDWYVRKEILAE